MGCGGLVGWGGCKENEDWKHSYIQLLWLQPRTEGLLEIFHPVGGGKKIEQSPNFTHVESGPKMGALTDMQLKGNTPSGFFFSLISLYPSPLFAVLQKYRLEHKNPQCEVV